MWLPLYDACSATRLYNIAVSVVRMFFFFVVVGIQSFKEYFQSSIYLRISLPRGFLSIGPLCFIALSMSSPGRSLSSVCQRQQK